MSPPGDHSVGGLPAEGRFLLGLSLALLNCCLSSLGFTLQRYAQLLSEGTAKGSPQWAKDRGRVFLVVGRSLYILAALPDLLSYTLLPQVVCTTVACFRLVLVTFLAHFLLQERVARREVLGMVACSVGTFACLVFGPREPGSGSPDATEGQLYHPQVIVYMVGGIVVLVALLLAEHSSYFRKSKDFRSVSLPLATGLAFAIQKVFNTEIGFLARGHGMEALMSNPGYVAMCSAVVVLGLTDFYLNSRGARVLPVQVFVPVSFALCTSLQFFQSFVIFEEFSEMDVLSATQASLGAITSLVGAMLIKPPRLSSRSPELLEDLAPAPPPLTADSPLPARIEEGEAADLSLRGAAARAAAVATGPVVSAAAPAPIMPKGADLEEEEADLENQMAAAGQLAATPTLEEEP